MIRSTYSYDSEANPHISRASCAHTRLVVRREGEGYAIEDVRFADQHLVEAPVPHHTHRNNDTANNDIDTATDNIRGGKGCTI